MSDSISSTFGGIPQKQSSDELPPEIVIEFDQLFLNMRFDDSENTIFITPKKRIRVRKLKRVAKTIEAEDYVLICVRDVDGGLDSHSLTEYLFKLFKEIFFYSTSSISGIHYLPASRSGLYQALNAFSQIFAELSRKRAFLSKKVEIPSISEPLSDYFLKLSEIGKKTNPDNIFEDLAKEIELNIIHGKIEYDFSTKKILYTPDNSKVSIDIAFASSMVAELSPIVAFLRYIISEKGRKFRGRGQIESSPIIIIEEPEAHLHPTAQASFVETLIKIVGLSGQVIITTHSNFVFNKINNCIIANDELRKNSVALLFAKSPGIDRSIATPIQISENGILDNNFASVSENLFNERIELFNSK